MPKENKGKKNSLDRSDKRAESKENSQVPAKKEEESRDLINRFFDQDFWLEPFNAFRFPKIFSRQFPRVDISETDKEIKVVADVPGVDPDHIEIEVHDDKMTISGETRKEKEEKATGEKPYRFERSYGEFRREFTLPSRVKEDQVKAVCKNGILTVTLPKSEDKRNKIRVDRE